MKPLIAPAGYLLLSYKGRITVQFIVPIVLSSAAFIFIFPLSVVDVREDGGLISAVNYLIAFTIGFFVASLAAVASLSDPRLDEPTSGLPVTAKIKEKGKYYDVVLSRRQYLSRLFAYLAYISVILYVGGTVAQVAEGSWPEEFFFVVLGYTLIFIYLNGIWSLLVNLMIGIYYFGDKMHRPRSERL